MVEWVVVYTRLEEASVDTPFSYLYLDEKHERTGAIMLHSCDILAYSIYTMLSDQLKFDVFG